MVAPSAKMEEMFPGVSVAEICDDTIKLNKYIEAVLPGERFYAITADSLLRFLGKYPDLLNLYAYLREWEEADKQGDVSC